MDNSGQLQVLLHMCGQLDYRRSGKWLPRSPAQVINKLAISHDDVATLRLSKHIFARTFAFIDQPRPVNTWSCEPYGE